MSAAEDFFTPHLLGWYHSRPGRAMPWKKEKDAYKVWVSEIILQQTRVAQGLNYYNRFIANFPDIRSLATAAEDQLMQVWQGLGYYSRARNMKIAANQLIEKFNGTFPETKEELLQLKGIGPYTAAAIASFAFSKPEPVVDGNVYRVLSRYFNDNHPIDHSNSYKHYLNRAKKLIEKKDPASFNQAIMDLGAELCHPKNPTCDICPLLAHCRSNQMKNQDTLPFKSNKIKSRDRFFLFLFYVLDNEYCIIEKRVKKDIWEGLYQFPMIEMEGFPAIFKQQDGNVISYLPELLPEIAPNAIKNISNVLTQKLTHQNIFAIFVETEIMQRPGRLANENQIIVPLQGLNNYAFPVLIKNWISKVLKYND
jgi:A/G-specific adenine glycosylase